MKSRCRINRRRRTADLQLHKNCRCLEIPAATDENFEYLQQQQQQQQQLIIDCISFSSSASIPLRFMYWALVLKARPPRPRPPPRRNELLLLQQQQQQARIITCILLLEAAAPRHAAILETLLCNQLMD
jgi:hypothetical protein